MGRTRHTGASRAGLRHLLMTATRVIAFLLAMIPVPGLTLADQAPACTGQTVDRVLPPMVGASIVAALSNGGSDGYDIELRAGDFVTITIDSQAIDVGARLVAPDGTALADVNHRQSGERLLSAILQKSGSHRLEIRALETSSASGCYTITIRELHVAQSRDTARVEAWRLFVEGEALWAEERGAAAMQAVERFRRASEVWKGAADTSGQALACRRLGEALHALGKPDEALKPLRESLELSHRAGQAEPEAAALNAMARVCLDLGRMEEASTNAGQALDLEPCEPHSAHRAAEALNALGDIYSFSGRLAESLAAYTEAFDISHGLRDRDGEATALLNQGYARVDLGRVGEAQTSYEEALSIWDDTGHSSRPGRHPYCSRAPPRHGWRKRASAEPVSRGERIGGAAG